MALPFKPPQSIEMLLRSDQYRNGEDEYWQYPSNRLPIQYYILKHAGN